MIVLAQKGETMAQETYDKIQSLYYIHIYIKGPTPLIQDTPETSRIFILLSLLEGSNMQLQDRYYSEIVSFSQQGCPLGTKIQSHISERKIAINETPIHI